MSKLPSSAQATTPVPANLAGDALADWQLVQRTLGGEQKAFELLVIKYQTRLERLVARMVRHSDSVPDIVQDSFINAYKALHQFRGDAQFYTWLYRIAMNTARKALLEMKRDPTVNESALLPADAPDDETFAYKHEPTSNETPESLVAAQQIAQAVHTAMDALPEDHRRALALREMDGLSYEEIAELMGCPIGTVRSRIFRAREAVAATLRPHAGKSQRKTLVGSESCKRTTFFTPPLTKHGSQRLFLPGWTAKPCRRKSTRRICLPGPCMTLMHA